MSGENRLGETPPLIPKPSRVHGSRPRDFRRRVHRLVEHRRLHVKIGFIPPAEYEDVHYCHITRPVTRHPSPVTREPSKSQFSALVGESAGERHSGLAAYAGDQNAGHGASFGVTVRPGVVATSAGAVRSLGGGRRVDGAGSAARKDGPVTI
jgi:hypothetical protein